MKEDIRPKWYFSKRERPDFDQRWGFFGFKVWVGRVKEVDPDFIVFNIYTPWFSCGYAW